MKTVYCSNCNTYRAEELMVSRPTGKRLVCKICIERVDKLMQRSENSRHQQHLRSMKLPIWIPDCQ
jgi:hypothetical protein